MRSALLASASIFVLATSAHAGTCTLYVATNGSDGGSGSQAAPFASISRAALLAKAGDTVCVAPGTYAGGIVSSANGTASAPITYKANGTVTIAPSSADAVWTVRGDNTIVDGFAMSGPNSRLGVYMTGSNNAATNNTVTDIATRVACSGQGAAGIEIDAYNGGSGGTIGGNTVAGVGPAGCNTDQGIYIAAPGVTVMGNKVSGAGGNGITQWHNADASTITGNTAVSNGSAGITIGNGDAYKGFSQPSSNNTVTGNVVSGNTNGVVEYGAVGPGNIISGNGGSAATPSTVTPQPTTPASRTTIKPGQSLTDASGNTWTISASGSIQENGQWTPGGGGTAALTIGADGTVFGLDNGHGPVNPGGWFTLSSNGQYWGVSNPPSGLTVKPATGIPTPNIPLAPMAPGPVGQCAPTATASGGFHVSNGQIIGPDGKPFIARGINVSDNDMGQAGQMIQMFPGLNFVRLAVYRYQDPGAYADFISTMTERGTVVEIEHHVETNGATGGGGQGDIASGTWLAQENAFYQAIAAAYKSNPFVWFGTDNEPPNAPGLSQWQQATYNAIRGTGNNNPILMEIMGWPGAWNNGMDPAVYAQMHNVAWDTHFYGWTAKSTDQTVVDKTLADEIAQVQQIQSADGMMPAIIAEWGPSTTGQTLDANSNQVITAVANATGSGKWGSAAWHWGQQDCCNNLNNGSNLTAPLGQSVALMIGTDIVPLTTCQANVRAQQQTNTILQAMQQTPQSTVPAGDVQTPAVQPTDTQLVTGDALAQQARAVAQSGDLARQAIAAAAQ